MQTPLFHYTNQAGLRGIIENKSLWFTDIFFLNDATEFEYTFTLVQEELDKRITRKYITDADSDENLIFSFMKATCYHERFIKDAAYYVFSFTSKPDDLSQWRAYSDDGGGYCIEFDFNKIIEIAKEKKIQIVESIYKDGEQREKIQQIINKTYEYWKTGDIINLIKTRSQAICPTLTEDDKSRISEITTALKSDLFILAPGFKHPKFSEEKEWRMFGINWKSKGLPLQFRSGKTMLIPYLDIKIAGNDGKLPIKCIFIGPTNHPKLSKIAVEDLLKAYSVECEVALSGIPYRAKL